MKDKLGGIIMKDFVNLRLKMYLSQKDKVYKEIYHYTYIKVWWLQQLFKSFANRNVINYVQISNFDIYELKNIHEQIFNKNQNYMKATTKIQKWQTWLNNKKMSTKLHLMLGMTKNLII